MGARVNKLESLGMSLFGIPWFALWSFHSGLYKASIHSRIICDMILHMPCDDLSLKRPRHICEPS